MLRLKKLFEPISISGVDIKNRIVMSPMCTYFAAADGSVTSRLIAYLEERARGGVGLIITGYSFIDGESSREVGNQIGVHNDRMIPGLNRLAERVQGHGAKIFLQLNNCGRKTNEQVYGDRPRGKSSGSEEALLPEELSTEEIKEVVDSFGRAAGRAKLAGFDGVEISATPKELVTAFISEHTNRRNDMYGGDFTSRMRFPREIIAKVREFVGKDFPIGFRFGAGEDLHHFGGKEITLSIAKRIAVFLEENGVDYLNVFRVMLPMYVTQGFFVSSEKIKQEVDIPVIAVGSVTDPVVAERVLSDGKVDLVALGRALIADPEWPRKAREGRYKDICGCIRCNDCIGRLTQRRSLKCSVNVMVGLEGEGKVSPALVKKRVAVVGGGPAGLEASLTAALRGHEVTLFERGRTLGGRLHVASRPDFKTDIRSLVERFRRRVEEASIKVVLEKEVRLETIEEGGFDVVIIATGFRSKLLRVPGEEGERVFTAEDILSDPQKDLGERVLVIGGGVTGCEAALFIAGMGKKVEVVEVAEDILIDERVEFNRTELIRMLKKAEIKVHTSVRVERITKVGVRILDKNGKEILMPADSTVIAVGSEPNRDLLDELKGKDLEVYCIGDCASPRKIFHAIHEGFLIGSSI